MYAVIETGGKQYRVRPGDVIDVELLPTGEDSEIVFDRVLLVGGDGDIKVGAPLVEGAQVHGVLRRELRAPKIRVFKMKRRKGYRRKNGHRQNLLQVEIKDIQG